jgi:hypothetical protein
MWHSVYTPTESVTSGGHMLVYETLHLTWLARAYDSSKDKDGVQRQDYATNESNAVDRQLLRMMLALPDLVHDKCK